MNPTTAGLRALEYPETAVQSFAGELIDLNLVYFILLRS